MKRLLFSHMSDIDGMGEVILGKIAFEELDYILSKNVADLEKNFMKEYNVGKLYEYDIIYITDLSLTKPTAEIVYSDEKLKDKVYIFDHHETAFNSGLNEYDNVTVKISDENGICCATQLFYEYLVNNSFIEKTRLLDDFVELVRQEDTYEWKKNNNQKAHDLAILYNCLGIDKYIQKMIFKLKGTFKEAPFEFDPDELDDIYMKKQSTKAKVESFIEDLKIIKVDEYDIGVCFIGYEYRNEVADYLKDTMKYDIDAVAMFAFENNQISLRSIKDNSSARIVAEKYGGGGHDKAAAIHITKEMKSSIIDLIF